MVTSSAPSKNVLLACIRVASTLGQPTQHSLSLPLPAPESNQTHLFLPNPEADSFPLPKIFITTHCSIKGSWYALAGIGSEESDLHVAGVKQNRSLVF